LKEELSAGFSSGRTGWRNWPIFRNSSSVRKPSLSVSRRSERRRAGAGVALRGGAVSGGLLKTGRDRLAALFGAERRGAAGGEGQGGGRPGGGGQEGRRRPG